MLPFFLLVISFSSSSTVSASQNWCIDRNHPPCQGAPGHCIRNYKGLKSYKGGFVANSAHLETLKAERFYLPHQKAWVDEDAQICDSAIVGPHVVLLGYAKISGNAHVSGDIRLSGRAQVFGDAHVSGVVRLYDEAKVFDQARIEGESVRMGGQAAAYGEAKIFGLAELGEEAEIFGNALLEGNVKVFGQGKVFGDAHLHGVTGILEPWIPNQEPHSFGQIFVFGHARVFGNTKIYADSDSRLNTERIYVHRKAVMEGESFITQGDYTE